MNRNVVLALLAGLLGGMLTRYVAPPAAFAQNQARPTAEIRAESFTLVDSTDRAVGTFSTETQKGMPAFAPRRIVLRDPSGKILWSAGGSVLRPLSER
jgi:hypothetical protein